MLSAENLDQPVYLATGITDMRKSIDGLAALVQESFQLNPFSPCLFVFCNREGYLHVDGYAGYHDVENAKLVGCWSHYPRCMIIRESMLKAEEIRTALRPSQIIITAESA